MDTSNYKLLADINSAPEQIRGLFTTVPKHLQAEAERELSGRREAYVNPNKQTALVEWAKKKQKQRRAKARLAKASRKKNRA